MIRWPWKDGPAAGAAGPVVISATRFEYRRRRDMPMVSLIAWRLRRGWRSRPGAVGLSVGGELARPVTYSLSVWTSEEDLRRFLRSPEHVRVVRGYKRRLVESRAVVWHADRFLLEEAWREALARLAAPAAAPESAAA